MRWGAGGKGKRGGVRVIYTTRLANGVIVALTIYGKGAVENIPAHILRWGIVATGLVMAGLFFARG